MTRKQLQLEVCKALLDSNKRLYGASINEKEVAVTTTGFDVFVLDKTECIFDMSRIPKHEALVNVLSDHDEDVEITDTGRMFLEKTYNRRTIKEYTGGNLTVFVDAKLSNKFKNAKFYAHHPHDRIIVKDHFDRKIGAFLPINFTTRKDYEV